MPKTEVRYGQGVSLLLSETEVAVLERLRAHVLATTGRSISRGEAIRMAIRGERPDLMAQQS